MRGAAEILRARETRNKRNEVRRRRVDRRSARIRAESVAKKNFVVAYSTGNSPFVNRFSTRLRACGASVQARSDRSALDSLGTAHYSEVLHAQSKLHAGRIAVARLPRRLRLPSRSRCFACSSTTAPPSSATASTRASAIGSCSRCRSAPSTRAAPAIPTCMS